MKTRPNGAHPARALVVVSLSAALVTAGCTGDAEPQVAAGASHAEEHVVGEASTRAPSPQGFHVPPPPFSEGVFPCTDCHDPEIPVNTKRRAMAAAHTEIVFHHDEENRWCLDCHDAGNRDMLHLASGELVSFEESYRLCGQCHGDKYRDWRAGVHGRRTGHWDGEKEYLLCVHCHNSHAPAFQPIEPLPAPIPPKRTP